MIFQIFANETIEFLDISFDAYTFIGNNVY